MTSFLKYIFFSQLLGHLFSQISLYPIDSPYIFVEDLLPFSTFKGEEILGLNPSFSSSLPIPQGGHIPFHVLKTIHRRFLQTLESLLTSLFLIHSPPHPDPSANPYGSYSLTYFQNLSTYSYYLDHLACFIFIPHLDLLPGFPISTLFPSGLSFHGCPSNLLKGK